MPVNVSTPVWACKVCGTRFGGDHDTAARCESAPLPVALPAGTPMLSSRNGLLVLQRLDATGHIGTDASRWNDVTGHYHFYRPRGEGTQDTGVRGDRLLPGTPGSLQHHAQPHSRLSVHAGVSESGSLDMGALYAHVGLLLRGAPGLVGHRWGRRDPVTVRPITPQVRAVFDLLGARVDETPFRSDIIALAWLTHLHDGATATATGLARVLPHAPLVEHVREANRRWWAGEPDVLGFMPAMTATSHLTPSKLTKHHKALIAATGVPWPARTSAAEYVRILTRETLMDTTPTTDRPWGHSRVIAVGGGKGGVGKSTVAIALARRIAATGRSVTLLDLDLDSPTQTVLNGLGHEVPLAEDGNRVAGVEVAPNLRVLSPGQIPSLPAHWSAPQARQWLTFVTEHVALGEVVVLDMPPGHGVLGDDVYGKHGRYAADVRLLVTTADPAALAATARARVASDHHGLVPTFLVENASVVSDGTHTIRLYGADGDVEEFASAARVAHLGSLPWVPGGDLATVPAFAALDVLAAPPGPHSGDAH